MGLDPPLGNTRLHIVKLVAAVLMTNTPNINQQLSELQIFSTLLDLFFKYEYNNFLHTQLVHCLHTVLAMPGAIAKPQQSIYPNEDLIAREQREQKEEEDQQRKTSSLLTHVFEDCRLIQRILDAWNDNRLHQENCGQRKGYMGHLTIITNQILETMENGGNSEKLKGFIQGMAEEDQDRWERFVAEPLAEINDKNSRQLGGCNPKQVCSEDEDEPNYGSSFDNGPQQAFNDYQLQQITSNFSDQFGFAENDYTENDDNDKFSAVNQVDFDIEDGTDTENRLEFEKFCMDDFPNIEDSIEDDETNAADLYENVDDDDEWQNTNATSSIFENSANRQQRVESTGSNDADEQSASSTKPVVDKPEAMDTSSDNNVTKEETKEVVTGEFQLTPRSSDQTWFDENKVPTSPTKETSDNWANFDEFNSSKPQENVVQELPSRALDYAVTDMTTENTESYDQTQQSAIATETTESMDCNEGPSTKKESSSSVTEEVAMEVVEASNKPAVVEVSSTGTNTQDMEVDDCPPTNVVMTEESNS